MNEELELGRAYLTAELAAISGVQELDDAEDMLDACERICGKDHPAALELRAVLKKQGLLTYKE
jgi:hypothetical protein